MIKVKKTVANQLGENSYLLYDDSGECIFVDPGYSFEEEKNEITQFVADHNLKPVSIVNTHCHFDHIMGVEFVRKTFNIPFLANKAEVFFVEGASDQALRFGIEMGAVSLPDQYIDETQSIRFGTSELSIIHVPGHSPGHVVFYSRQDGFILAGDVLFYGSIGRTDLPGGNHNDLIRNIKEKLFTLPDSTKVYSGHGPETTLGFEKQNNPFLS